MLAGLIFATEDADDRPGTLAETLPFGGLTLIEFQVRLLVAAGATQLILVVARMTPELLGAIGRIGRIGRRGGSLDAVRTARDVVEKLHPLARVLVVADGVVTTGDVVALLAAAPGDTLLVTEDGDPRYERVGARTAWAGLAALDGQRIAEVAAMPSDYDFQSTLLRVAAQGGADQLRLPPEHVATHGIERAAVALAARSGATLTTLLARPLRWAERWVAVPLTRLALPPLLARGVPSGAVLAGGAAAALAGGVAIAFGHAAIGLGVALIAMLLASLAAALAGVRDEAPLLLLADHGRSSIAAAAALLVGLGAPHPTGVVLASAAIIAGVLAERAAVPAHQRRWWASPLAYLLVMLPLLLLDEALVALCAAALYAAATLAAGVEAFREKP